MNEKERKSLAALQELGLEIADRWASGLQKRPTQQLVLQKVIEPVVRHILNTIFPWIIGVAVLFLVLVLCTVITCVIVLRQTGPYDVCMHAATLAH
jgi:type IV secretory pathway component VirB8